MVAKDNIIREKYSYSPHKPGVYIFRDASGKPLYIGKARDLKKRLASYVVGKPTIRRIARMLKYARDIEWIVTDNELEALILEANLVRKHKPHYNIDLKDDKRYPYLKITNEPFPRVFVVRRKEPDGAKYFGPYADRLGATKLTKTIRTLFRIRTCKYNLPSHKPKRPCVLFEIGRCVGPCTNECNAEIYRIAVNEVEMFLRGKRRELLEQLRTQMEKASEELQFEKAAFLRDTIGQIERMMTQQKMEGDIEDRDFIVIVFGGGVGVAVIFRIRQGTLIARQTIPLTVPKMNTFPEILSEFIPRFYAEDGDVPCEILVQEQPSDVKEISSVLMKMRGSAVEIRVPQRGNRYQTLILARNNAELIHSEMMMQKEKVHVPYGVLELERLLQLPKAPNIIEAFDISNIGRGVVVASMVQFIEGKANRNGYRHFNIKSFIGQDDFAGMREVVFRRYRRLLDENKQLPDLILIDGGKGQLSAALDSLQKLELEQKIPVVAIAKRIDELFIPNRSDSIMLPRDSAALRLLQRIRDEAHRFAIAFSRKSHRHKAMQLELTEIDGIGQKRAIALLKEFGSIDALVPISPEEITQRTSLPIKLAQALKAYLESNR